MSQHFVVKRNLKRAAGNLEYHLGQHIVEEMLEELLAMAEVDHMELVSSFIWDNYLFLIFNTVHPNALPITPYEKEKLENKFMEHQKKSWAEKAMEKYIEEKETKKEMDKKGKPKGRKRSLQ